MERFRKGDYRFASQAKLNDMWLEVDRGHAGRGGYLSVSALRGRFQVSVAGLAARPPSCPYRHARTTILLPCGARSELHRAPSRALPVPLALERLLALLVDERAIDRRAGEAEGPGLPLGGVTGLRPEKAAGTKTPRMPHKMK